MFTAPDVAAAIAAEKAKVEAAAAAASSSGGAAAMPSAAADAKVYVRAIPEGWCSWNTIDVHAGSNPTCKQVLQWLKENVGGAEVQRLCQEREALLASGAYCPGDPLIQQLEQRIRACAAGAGQAAGAGAGSGGP